MGKSATFFMQGGNRAPNWIRADDEGPNIGFTTGYTARQFREELPTRHHHTLNENGDPCAFEFVTSS